MQGAGRGIKLLGTWYTRASPKELAFPNSHLTRERAIFISFRLINSLVEQEQSIHIFYYASSSAHAVSRCSVSRVDAL